MIMVHNMTKFHPDWIISTRDTFHSMSSNVGLRKVYIFKYVNVVNF